MSTLRTLTASSALAALAATTLTLVPAGAPLGVTEGHAPYATSVTQPKAVWKAADHDAKVLTGDAADTTSLPTVHSVYVYPSDGTNRFAQYAAYFQAEQRRGTDNLKRYTGMGFRWDERPAQDGTSRVLHDITVVKAKANMRSLSSSKQFGLVGDALRAAGLTNPNKKYYVWLDAKSVNCGQGQGSTDVVRSAANAAEKTGYGVSYRPTGGEELYAANGGWCNPVLHELSHMLGAVNPQAPHYVAGGHCTDDGQDQLCNASSGPRPYDPQAPRTYDTNNDDYLDPSADLDPNAVEVAGRAKLPWWTVNLSRFLCPRSTDPARPDCSTPNRPVY